MTVSRKYLIILFHLLPLIAGDTEEVDLFTDYFK